MRLLFVSILLISKVAMGFTLGSTNSSQGGWTQRLLVINYNLANCPATISVTTALSEAVKIWNSVATSNLTLAVGGPSSDTPATLSGATATDTPTLVCDTSFSADSGLDGNFAAGVGRFGTIGNTITYGYILLNVEAGKNDNISNFSQTILNIVVAHEIGHVIGLGHSSDQSALMYYNSTGKTTLALAQDDIDGITYLYPRNEPFSDKTFGCGVLTSSLAQNSDNSEGPPPAVLALLFLPLFLVLSLKYRDRFS